MFTKLPTDNELEQRQREQEKKIDEAVQDACHNPTRLLRDILTGKYNFLIEKN